jgi:hypothetical protein
MSEYADKVLTENYRDKIYEIDLTRLYFDVQRSISNADFNPSLENVRGAYSVARNFCEAVVFSKTHLERYSKLIKPVISDIQLILYGDSRDARVFSVCQKYNAYVRKVRGDLVLLNGAMLMNQIHEMIFLIKQWAYEEGLFLPKPIDKKYGTGAISDSLGQ